MVEKQAKDFRQAPSPLGDRFDEDEDTAYEALDEQEIDVKKARDDDYMEALRGQRPPP